MVRLISSNGDHQKACMMLDIQVELPEQPARRGHVTAGVMMRKTRKQSGPLPGHLHANEADQGMSRRNHKLQ
jgi:hypothetical protein